MNINQAFECLLADHDMRLIGKYYNRIESRLFLAANFGRESREIGFKHIVKCFKQDFREISTHYSGSKSDCKFTWDKEL